MSTGLEALDGLLAGGFPDRSAILITGPPGVGKEVLCYWFLSASLHEDGVAIYVSRRSFADVVEDSKGYGVNLGDRLIVIDCSGLPPNPPAIGCSLNDLTQISVTLKKLVAENMGKRIRIVVDILSPLLLLNSLEPMYRFFSSLLIELKKYDAVAIMTLEEGMHASKEVVAFEQFFDGVLEMRFYEQALRVLPLLQVKKIRGLPLQPGFYNFHFRSNQGMEISAYTR